MAEFAQGCWLCVCALVFPMHHDFGWVNSVTLLYLFCNTVIIPQCSFKTRSRSFWKSMGLSPLIPEGYSQCVWNRPSNNLVQPKFVSTVACCTQSSWHSLRVAKTFERFYFLLLCFLTWNLKHNLYKWPCRKGFGDDV